MEMADLHIDDWQRIQNLVTTYADLRLGGTDASVVALAERRGASRIATLNRRHLAVFRLRHANAFELLVSDYQPACGPANRACLGWAGLSAATNMNS
jgi:hypothetical protein